MEKTYWACVSGAVEPAEGMWQDHVRKLPSVPRVEIVTADARGALEAILQYRVVGQTPQGSWLEIKPLTGRTHQIRVQAASRGFPLLGDRLYGSTTPFGPLTADERERAIALHARSLTFQHPTTRESSAVIAETPVAWLSLQSQME
jgi:23S rRNA-/tRNA-specific pseudouridylate synthase